MSLVLLWMHCQDAEWPSSSFGTDPGPQNASKSQKIYTPTLVRTLLRSTVRKLPRSPFLLFFRCQPEDKVLRHKWLMTESVRKSSKVIFCDEGYRRFFEDWWLCHSWPSHPIGDLSQLLFFCADAYNEAVLLDKKTEVLHWWTGHPWAPISPWRSHRGNLLWIAVSRVTLDLFQLWKCHGNVAFVAFGD